MSYCNIYPQDKRKSEGSGTSSNGKTSEKDKRDNENSSLKSFPPKASATADDVRLSCRKMLANALKGNYDKTRHNMGYCRFQL